MGSNNQESNKAQDTENYDPLQKHQGFDTRDDAIGLRGYKDQTGADWEAVVMARPKVCPNKGESVDMGEVGQGEGGPIHINFEWTEPKPKTFFDKIKYKIGLEKAIDLDVGCFYELTTGKRGILQAFGNAYGSYDEAPYIELKGDDRTGHSTGEDLYINAGQWHNIRRVILYAYIYDGVAKWSETDAYMRFLMPDHDPVDVYLRAFEDDLPVCAIAQVINIDGGMKISSLNEYFPGHAEMSRSFGFGINWEEGRKE